MVLSKPYTFSAEVYSWSIILWQVIKKYVPKVRVASKSTVLGYVIQDHEQKRANHIARDPSAYSTY